MLKPAENERITRVGPGTPMGNLMRRFWLPAVLSEELPEPDAAPVRVRLLGEDFVAFRDAAGNAGIVDAFCPHRRAPMFFGRNEEGGLRCVYHGWKFDRHGTCTDMPSEPPDSLFKTKVTIAAPATHEAGGIVWAFLGDPAAVPPPPDYEFTRAPATHRAVTKFRQASNWLQGLEGSVDSTHSGFLHNNDVADRELLRNRAPAIEFEPTAYGLQGAAIHPLPGGRQYARTFHYLLPFQSVRGRRYDRRGRLERVPTISGQLFVPIDDEHTWVYNTLHAGRPEIPLDAAFLRADRLKAFGSDEVAPLPGYALRRTAANDYLLDRRLQRERSYSGIEGMNTQDIALQEQMGPIVDRSHEHLAGSDQVIILVRRLLAEAMDAAARGEQPRGLDPASHRDVRGSDEIMPATDRWQDTLAGELTAKF